MEIKKRKTAMVKRICLTCGKEFEAPRYKIKLGGGKYCKVAHVKRTIMQFSNKL